jgi:hypothetical protein
MNHRLILNLIAIPTLAGSMLTIVVMSSVASATETLTKLSTAIAPTPVQASCDLPTKSSSESSVMQQINRGVLVASSSEIPGEYPVSDFSTAESDAAVNLFGCDCLACIKALRQLRSQSWLNNTQGHCWSSLQQRVSQQEIQKVLQTLEAEEAN